MMRRIFILIVGMLWFIQPLMAERVIFVGDSITGHAENLADGYAKQMRKALSDAGVEDVEIVCLGGSGQGVSSWLNVVKKSKDSDSMMLDVKDVYVKKELDQGTDTLVIFLGMNDVLAPYTDFNSIDKWEENYQKLIDALKERTSFKNLILAGPTMCTENPSSYRNKLANQLTTSLNKIAENNNAKVTLSRDVFIQYWKWLRMNNPTGRITRDYVHPNKIGHTAITVAMLNAIGYQDAAQKWFDKVGVPAIGEKGINESGMLLYIDNTSDTPFLKIKGEVANIIPKKIDVTLPETMKLVNVEQDGNAFTITINGSVPNLKDTIKVLATDEKKTVEQQISIYAPWLVCSDISTPRWFNAADYKDSEHVTPIDEAVLNGENPLIAKNTNDALYDWKVYYPSADVTGGDNPDSVDFSTLSRSRAFDMGYMARDIYSKKAGKAKLDISSKIFAGNIHYTIYWNGKVVYSSVTRNDSTEVDVKEGINTLVVKSSHVTWQWQNAVSVTPLTGITADDLKYALPMAKAN
jgi:lysophospholipase L1-like esterase/acylphosphatase